MTINKSQTIVSDIHSFPPIAGNQARILILGSMPGKASLQADQYYAHPRNHFWPIMAEILGFDPAANYSQKTQTLIDSRVALWDVMKSCNRHGSLDADIDKNSIVANDFADFFRTHLHIHHVFFNGAAAEQTFRRLVQPDLAGGTWLFQRLPSTSPANAALSYQQKLLSWQTIATVLAKPC